MPIFVLPVLAQKLYVAIIKEEMMNQEIRLVAIVDFKQESDIQLVLPTVMNCVQKSRQEKGNIFYTVSRELNNPKRLVFVEHWANNSAISQHADTVHFKELEKALSPYQQRPMEILVLSEINV